MKSQTLVESGQIGGAPFEAKVTRESQDGDVRLVPYKLQTLEGLVPSTLAVVTPAVFAYTSLPFRG